MMNGTYIFLVSVSVILILAYTNNAFAEPTLKDSTLKVQEYVSGLTFPTSMVFLDNSNLLVLEKNGNVTVSFRWHIGSTANFVITRCRQE